MRDNDIPSQAIFTERGHMPKYTEREKNELRVALEILGASEDSHVCEDYIEALGYDIYKIGYYGKPSMSECKRKASTIIFDMITKEDNTNHIIETDG